MSISSQYTKEKQRAQERSAAIKILDLMKPLRMSNSSNKARRWIWELLQNAKDVCDEKVKIKIDFNEQEKVLRFFHNGKPFNVQSITYLIEQVSTKERDASKSETTGKFGTGFVTTHLLSEIVDVDSVIEDDEDKLRKFSITLDRSGRNIEDILSAIEKSAQQLKQVDNNAILADYNDNDFNTCFTYKLNDYGVEVAKQGLADLNICLPYAMIFLNKIESVYLSHCNVLYEIYERRKDDKVSIFDFHSSENSNIITRSYIYAKHECIQIAFPLNKERNGLVQIDEKCPRIFCDFPLIGTESFPFPGIIQSKYFNPTEPRDAIYLSYNDEPEVVQNVELMSEALSLFRDFCEYFSKERYEKLCYLFDINRNYKNDNVDKSWLNTELIEILEQNLLFADVIKTTDNKFISVLDGGNNPNIYFPNNKKSEIREELWTLYSKIDQRCLPYKYDCEEWYKFLWKDCPRLDIDKILLFLNEISTMDSLLRVFNTQDENEAIGWLNSFVKLTQNDQVAWTEIKEDEWPILMNQNGQLCAFSKLSKDIIENEILKDIIDDCGYNIKNELLDIRIQLNDIELKNFIDDNSLVKTISSELTNKDFSNKVDVAEKIIVLYSESNREKTQIICDFYERLYGSLNNRQNIHLEDECLWEETELLLINRIVKSISDVGVVCTFADKYEFTDEKDVVLWIADLVDFLEKNYETVDRKKIAILPNQNGVFCSKELIKLDDGEIDDDIKDICMLLGEDYRDELLDKNIYLNMSEQFVVHEIDVVESIRRNVEEYWQSSKPEEVQKAFDKLIVWFSKNEYKAKKLFGIIYENKHRLYNDETIAKNIEKAEEIDQVLEEFNITDIRQLRILLTNNKEAGTFEQAQNWTIESVANLGITSPEEFEAFVQDYAYVDQFDHKSKPTTEMFQFAQQLIARAKNNIKAHLLTLPEYDCSDLEELSTTILGGIKKNGFDISIVVRPSDYGEVLIYYSAETDLLMYEVSELWIDDAKSVPRQLTLGEILKSTGIKRIPLRR